MRRRRSRTFSRPRRRARRDTSLDALLARGRSGPGRPGAPLEVVTPPTPTASSSERTGSHLTMRLSLVAVSVTALFAVLLVRLWSLQVIQGPQATKVAQSVTTRDIDLQPPRGEIRARGGQILAEDLAVEQALISKYSVDQNPFVIDELSALLQVSSAEIKQTFATDQYSDYTPIPVPTGPKGVTPQDVEYIEHHATQFPGVTVSLGYEREYPEDDLAAQTLGYVGQITQSELSQYKRFGYTNQVQVGQSGLESEYEPELHGEPGVEQVEVDPVGDIVKQVSETPPTPGDTLVTNLDLGLEQTVSNDLAADIPLVRAGLPGNGTAPTTAPWAAAVVLDANTGAVLASASYPYFNDNIWTGGISEQAYSALENNPGEPLNDYVIQSLEPPGSTFKLTTATAALNTGLITADTPINDPGSFTLGDQTFYDTAESHGAGELDVAQAITQSNDIFFYTLGAWFWEDRSTYGTDAIQKVAMEYGLGTTTGIDLPGAVTGQIDSPQLRLQQHAEDPQAFPDNTYQPGDNVEMAFGQGETLVDPIQMAQAYATFANGGTRYAPEVAAEIVSPDGKVVKTFKPTVLGHVPLPASTRDPMLEGFEGVTQQPTGTAYGAFQAIHFNFSKWNVAGKTGTATVSSNPDIADTAWFVGFGGPVNSSQQYVVAVEVDRGGYGASAAAPVAAQIFQYMTTHSIPAVTAGS